MTTVVRPCPRLRCRRCGRFVSRRKPLPQPVRLVDNAGRPAFVSSTLALTFCVCGEMVSYGFGGC